MLREGHEEQAEEDVEPAVMKKPAATADNDFQKSLDDFKEYVTKHKLEHKARHQHLQKGLHEN